jgi:flavin-binding protein dodecin
MGYGMPRRGHDDRYDGPEVHGERHEPRHSYPGYYDRPDYARSAAASRETHWGTRPAAHEGQASMVKVIEVFAQSPHSWEDAARRAVAEASRTIRGIRSVDISHMEAIVEDDQVVSFRIHAKIAFVLDERMRRERYSGYDSRR